MNKLKSAIFSILAFLTYPFYKHKIKKQIGENETLITLTPRWGDIVHGLLYLDEYKREYDKKIVCLVDEKYIDFAKCFNIDKIITYKHDSLTTKYVIISTYLEWINKKKKNNYLASPPSYFAFRGFDTREVMRDYVFNVAHDKPSFPNFPTSEITSIPDFEKNKDKIIIFNPYSGTQQKLVKLCQKIADTLVNSDYILYTNVVGKQAPLKNTLPLNCSMFEFHEIAPQVKMFVSIRSGIVDILYNTNAKILVLYSGFKWWRPYHSVKNIRTTNIEELYVKDADKACKVFSDFLNNNNSLVL